MSIQLPSYAKDLFKPKRYKCLFGGRGSGKSYTVARSLLILGKQKKIRVLCAREFQNSITESVHKLLDEQIDELTLRNHYSVTNTSIVGGNGTEFIFKGVRLNVNSIKSMVGITHLWLEEAHTISQSSYDVLIPTIREPNSEIWVTFNPDSEDDPTYKMFVDKNGEPNGRDDSFILKVNWNLNPWFPDVLMKEKDYLFKINPDLALHVWQGEIRRNSDSQIFKNKWEVMAFEPEEHYDGPYLGADFGFSNDPSCLVKVYIDRQKRNLMIRNAEFGYHVEIDYLPDLYHKIPNSTKYKIRADSARPETISFLKRKGYNIEAAKKWPNSVEDGIEFLRTWNKIIIHPDCEKEIIKGREKVKYGMITEAKNYSFKTDRLSGDVLTDVVDA
jgi:phage terminase large subunit